MQILNYEIQKYHVKLRLLHDTQKKLSSLLIDILCCDKVCSVNLYIECLLLQKKINGLSDISDNLETNKELQYLCIQNNLLKEVVDYMLEEPLLLAPMHEYTSVIIEKCQFYAAMLANTQLSRCQLDEILIRQSKYY